MDVLLLFSIKMSGRRIISDLEAFEGIKEANRKKYKLVWAGYKDFVGPREWETVIPSEDDVMNWCRHLRSEKKFASSTMWTQYSMLNAVVINKYGFNLKQFARVGTLLKSYDTDVKKKASIFTKVSGQ